MAEPETTLHEDLARAHRCELAGQLDEAAALYEHYLYEYGAQGESARIRRQVGSLHFRLGHLRRSLELDSGQQLTYFWLGNALYHRGRSDEAIRCFQMLLEQNPGFTVARFHLGVIFERQGRKEKAEEEFRRVLLKSPEDAAARHYLDE